MKLVLWLILTGPLAVQAVPKGERLTTTVGRVQDHVITSREVQINYFVEKSLYRSKKKSKLKALPTQGREFLREVTAVLLEWTVHLEAEAFAAAKVTSKEVTRAERTVLRRAARLPDWKKFGVREQELKKMVQRKLQAKKFIRFKVDSASVPITDAEAKEYFENNRLQFGNLPFDNFKTNIKAFLSRQQVDQRLKDWFEVLQAKYKVRNYLAEL